MNHSMKNRLVAMLLAVCTILGMGVPASASSIQDGSKTCTVAYAPVHTYLQTTAGTWLRACGYDYTTNDGLTGPAYCIDHGLYYTGKVLPITGKYTVSPQTAGAFANGYPQLTLETFLGLHQTNHPILSGTVTPRRWLSGLPWASLPLRAPHSPTAESGSISLPGMPSRCVYFVPHNVFWAMQRIGIRSIRPGCISGSRTTSWTEILPLTPT